MQSSDNAVTGREAATAREEIALAPITSSTSIQGNATDPEVKPAQDGESVSPQEAPPMTKTGLASLLALHLSSSWNARTCEFAFYLFLIQLFPDTLVRPAQTRFT